MSSETANRNISEEEKLPPECYREDALYHEYYPGEDEEGPYKTHEQKLRRLEELDNNGYCPLRLGEVFPKVDATTREELEKIEGERIKGLEQFRKRMENKEYHELERHSNDAKKQEEEDMDEAEK